VNKCDRSSECWKVYCKPSHPLLARRRSPATPYATTNTSSSNTPPSPKGSSGEGVNASGGGLEDQVFARWADRVVSIDILNGKTLPPPPLPPPSKLRPIDSTREGVACVLVSSPPSHCLCISCVLDPQYFVSARSAGSSTHEIQRQ